MIRTALLLPLALLGSCSLPGAAGSHPDLDSDLRAWTYVPDLPISAPPYREVHASWKQRLFVIMKLLLAIMLVAGFIWLLVQILRCCCPCCCLR